MSTESSLVMGESIPALLAEEWTIKPQSPFPSFLEMVMIHQTETAILETIPMVMLQIRLQLHNLTRFLQERRDASSSGDHATRFHQLLRLISIGLERLSKEVAGTMERYRAEITCFLRYVLERRCLRMTGACVSECVFGTKRVCVVGSDRRLSPLSNVAQTRLALFLAFSPYCKVLLEKWRERNSVGVRGQWWSKLKMLLPSLFSNTWHVADTWFLLCYLTGRSYHATLRDFIFRHVIRRLTQEDSPNSGATNKPSIISSSPIGKDSKARQLISMAAAAGFTVAAACWWGQVRFWYDEETRSQHKTSIPAPPALRPVAPSCPLCTRTCAIQPTVVSKSGFVFCNVCIRRFVREHATCPTTGRGPIESKDLVRLYEPTAQ